jgi:hypothetical protein
MAVLKYKRFKYTYVVDDDSEDEFEYEYPRLVDCYTRSMAMTLDQCFKTSMGGKRLYFITPIIYFISSTANEDDDFCKVLGYNSNALSYVVLSNGLIHVKVVDDDGVIEIPKQKKEALQAFYTLIERTPATMDVSITLKDKSIIKKTVHYNGHDDPKNVQETCNDFFKKAHPTAIETAQKNQIYVANMYLEPNTAIGALSAEEGTFSGELLVREGTHVYKLHKTLKMLTELMKLTRAEKNYIHIMLFGPKPTKMSRATAATADPAPSKSPSPGARNIAHQRVEYGYHFSAGGKSQYTTKYVEVYTLTMPKDPAQTINDLFLPYNDYTKNDAPSRVYIITPSNKSDRKLLGKLHLSPNVKAIALINNKLFHVDENSNVVQYENTNTKVLKMIKDMITTEIVANNVVIDDTNYKVIISSGDSCHTDGISLPEDTLFFRLVNTKVDSLPGIADWGEGSFCNGDYFILAKAKSGIYALSENDDIAYGKVEEGEVSPEDFDNDIIRVSSEEFACIEVILFSIPAGYTTGSPPPANRSPTPNVNFQQNIASSELWTNLTVKELPHEAADVKTYTAKDMDSVDPWLKRCTEVCAPWHLGFMCEPDKKERQNHTIVKEEDVLPVLSYALSKNKTLKVKETVGSKLGDKTHAFFRHAKTCYEGDECLYRPVLAKKGANDKSATVLNDPCKILNTLVDTLK